MTKRFTGIFTRMNLLCFHTNVFNQRSHTKNYFQTTIPIASYSGLPVNQSQHQLKAAKQGVLRIEIAASPEIVENTLLYNTDHHSPLCLVPFCFVFLLIIPAFAMHLILSRNG